MKKLIEWAEGEVSRGRKITLFSIIFTFIFITLLTFLMYAVGYGGNLEKFFTYYTAFGVLAGTAVGFYTGTSPSKIDARNGTLEYKKEHSQENVQDTE